MTDAGGSLEKLHRRFGTKAKRRLQIVTLQKKICKRNPKCILTSAHGKTIIKYVEISNYIFLDSSMVEHSAVNRVVVGSSPTRGALSEQKGSTEFKIKYGSMVKRLRHRPFTAVTGVQIPLESF